MNSKHRSMLSRQLFLLFLSQNAEAQSLPGNVTDIGIAEENIIVLPSHLHNIPSQGTFKSMVALLIIQHLVGFWGGDRCYLGSCLSGTLKGCSLPVGAVCFAFAVVLADDNNPFGARWNVSQVFCLGCVGFLNVLVFMIWNIIDRFAVLLLALEKASAIHFLFMDADFNPSETGTAFIIAVGLVLLNVWTSVRSFRGTYQLVQQVLNQARAGEGPVPQGHLDAVTNPGSYVLQRASSTYFDHVERINAPNRQPLINVNDPDEENATGRCKICMSANISTVFVPCNHAAACEECATETKDGLLKMSTCPLCREPIKKILKMDNLQHAHSLFDVNN